MKKPTPAEVAQLSLDNLRNTRTEMYRKINHLQAQLETMQQAINLAERLVDDLKTLEMPDPSKPQS